MKILYVAIKYDRGNPARGLSFEHQNFYLTLRKHHDVIYFPFDVVLKDKGRKAMNKALVEMAGQTRPDLCFFSFIDDEIEVETIQTITARGLLTLGWFSDDHWRFDNYSRYYAPALTWVVTTDADAVQKYAGLGLKNVILAHWAANPDVFRPSPRAKNIEVSFIGSWNKGRQDIIQELRKYGLSVLVKGSGWPAGRITQAELVSIIGRSKIHLGLNPPSANLNYRSFFRLFLKRLSFEESFWRIKPDFWHIFGNVREWRRKKIPQIKARTYEVPACATMLITHETGVPASDFVIGKEVITYKAPADLASKIKYFLEHAAEREQIAQAGYLRVRRDHTYEKRFRDIFDAIGIGNKT